jgi:hypothetical protein
MGGEINEKRGGLAQLASGVDVAIGAGRYAFRGGAQVPEHMPDGELMGRRL